MEYGPGKTCGSGLTYTRGTLNDTTHNFKPTPRSVSCDPGNFRREREEKREGEMARGVCVVGEEEKDVGVVGTVCGGTKEACFFFLPLFCLCLLEVLLDVRVCGAIPGLFLAVSLSLLGIASAVELQLKEGSGG